MLCKALYNFLFLSGKPISAFRWGLLLAAPCAMFALFVGRFTPNLLGEAAQPQLGPQDFGLRAVAVELPIGKGEHLRGVFVNAGRGAPVVLHLLGGGETLTARTKVAGEMVWVGDVVRDLVALGLSSLVLDYRGVGRSSGKRDSRQIPADAYVAWEEAVRRAGGHTRRVALRATSLGTLAAASLIEGGAMPGAIMLVAPLRAQTVAVHWLRARRSSLAAFLGWLFLRRPLAADQEQAISEMRAPLLIVFGIRDELLPSAERQRLLAAARAVGATVVERDQEHLPLMRDAHRLMPGERALYASLRWLSSGQILSSRHACACRSGDAEQSVTGWIVKGQR
ncbi:MAG: lysophospholipase [Candidatus Tectomicrobia bacterium]|nr:lysophospholipase [Candidatus Tectomicrobia bacterium]